jgi:hypothetical protein
MKTATFVKDVSENFTGEAKLYRLSDPIEYDKPWDDEDNTPAKLAEYVVVSATVALFSGPETYIFPTDENGDVLDWGELDGSYRGGLDHNKALSRAGYAVEEMNNE